MAMPSGSTGSPTDIPLPALGHSVEERAYAAIKSRILTGALAPKAHLTELGLSADLGISRTPIRKALQRLNEEGFVVLRRNRGAFVSEWTRRTLIEIAEVRAHLADMAGRLAAAVVDEATIETLHGICEELAAGLDEGQTLDVPAMTDRMFRFHNTVFAAAGNGLLENLFRQTTYVPVVQRTFHNYSPGDWQRIRAYTENLVHAFRIRDGECASALMKAYFLMSKEAIIAATPEINGPEDNTSGAPPGASG